MINPDDLKLDGYAALICDMDGTLIDSVGPNLEAWRRTCEHFGYPWDEPYMDSLGGVPTEGTVEILNQRFAMNCSVNEVSAFKESLFLVMDVATHLFPEIYQLLRNFAGNKPVAVGTGASRQHAEKALQNLDVLPHITALVTASDVTKGKPSADTFILAAEKMGVPPEHCVVLEDTPTGIAAAQAAGMDCFRCYRGDLLEFIAFE